MMPLQAGNSKASLVSAIDRVWAIDNQHARTLIHQLESISASDMTFASEALVTAGGSGVNPASTMYDFDAATQTAFIEISGIMLNKPSSIDQFNGACSMIMVRRAIRQAVASDEVKRIVLYVDTPGGQTEGMGELASDIKDASLVKPITAFVPSKAFSAGFWAASQCSKVVLGEFAFAGSIGVCNTVADAGEFWQKAGIKWHLISSGGIKGEGGHDANISNDFLAEVQTLVDHWTYLFVNAVAEGRGMDASAVSNLATGHIWTAKECVANGLADAVMTEDQFLASLEDMDDPDFWEDDDEDGERASANKDNFHENTTKEQRMDNGTNPGIVAKLGNFLKPTQQAKSAPTEETAGQEIPAHVIAMAKTLAWNEADKIVNQASARLAIPTSCIGSARDLYLRAMEADHGGTILPDDNGCVVEGPLAHSVSAFLSSLPSNAILEASSATNAEKPAIAGETINHNGSENAIAVQLKASNVKLAEKISKEAKN